MYAILQPYWVEPDAAVKPLTNRDIYRQVIKGYTPPADAIASRSGLVALRKKYQWHPDNQRYYTIGYDILERIRERYGLQYIQSSMDNILQRKHRWSSNNLPFFIRIFSYTTLVLTLLLFSFRHTTAKTFFLSILAAVILTILTSLGMAFSRYRDAALFNWILFYFLVSLCLSLLAFTMKKRSAVTGIATNLFLWLLPFMPLCAVARYYAHVKYDADYTYQYEYAVQQQQHLFLAEIGGVLLLLIMAGTYFHSVYRRWYAAPEN